MFGLVGLVWSVLFELLELFELFELFVTFEPFKPFELLEQFELFFNHLNHLNSLLCYPDKNIIPHEFIMSKQGLYVCQLRLSEPIINYNICRDYIIIILFFLVQPLDGGLRGGR